MTQRLIPINGATPTYNVLGRTYTCSANSVVDVPDTGLVPGGDSAAVATNGFFAVSTAGVGTTAQRPQGLPAGSTFADTTVGALIISDGKVWRNPMTGALV
jgi:hypothetical protein